MKKANKSVEDEFHKIKELEQEQIILLEINEYLKDKLHSFERSRETKGNVKETFRALKQVEKKIQGALDNSKILEKKLAKSIALLTASEKKYRSLYEGSPLLLRTINKKGIILDCNKAYAKRLGYSKQEVVRRSIFDHVADESLDSLKESFEIWKKTGKASQRELWFKRKDGTTFPVLLTASNAYDQLGGLVGSNTVIEDITNIYNARKKIIDSERTIRGQFEELKKLDSLKDEFLTMITHELKTPIVPIKGYVDILLLEKLGPLNEKQKDRLRLMSSSSAALLRLISDLLDAQKIEFGQLKLNKEKHDLAKLINKTIDEIKPEASRCGVTITTDLQPDLSCFCDALRIEQVVSNIVTNSLDFCPKEEGKIHIKSYAENAHAKVIIKDNGVGIEKNSLDKIFVKFYQADTSSTREHGGTGIGLSVCKGIVENHGGKIWAESEGRGKGAEIHILLPRLTD
ncbi:MAG: PAS domain-containing sensor histidine kinase [Nitrososphaerota archaeon]